MDYSTGSFGFFNQQDSFANLSQMHNYGSPTNNVPRQGSMMNPSAQYFYDSQKVQPALLSYQSPIQTASSYGISDRLLYDVLGKQRPIGVNPLDSNIAQKEYSSLSLASMSYDVGGAVGSLAGGIAGYGIGGGAAAVGTGIMGMSLGGLALGGVAGVGISLAADKAKETYMENYRMTQSVNALTGNIVGSNGIIGLSGRENANIAKFIKREASEDVLMEAEDVMSIAKTGQELGMFSGVSSASGFQNKVKSLKDTVKKLGDMLGSSDMQGLMQELGKFMMLGLDTQAGASMSGKMFMASKFAGISKEAMDSNLDASIAMGLGKGVDSRLIMKDVLQSTQNMKTMQQSGNLSPALMNSATYLAADRQANVVLEQRNTELAGVSRSQRLVYAKYKTERDGGTMQENLNSLLSMSEQEQRQTVFGFDGGLGYKGVIGDKTKTQSVVATIKGVENLNSGSSPFEALYNRAYDHYKTKGKGQEFDAEAISSFMLSGQNYDEKTAQLVTAKVKEIQEVGFEGYNRANKVSERMLDRRNTFSEYQRAMKDTSLYSSTKRGIDTFSNTISDFIGGFGSAGETQDFAREFMGNTSKNESYSRSISFGGMGLDTEGKERIARRLISSDSLDDLRKKDKSIDRSGPKLSDFDTDPDSGAHTSMWRNGYTNEGLDNLAKIAQTENSLNAFDDMSSKDQYRVMKRTKELGKVKGSKFTEADNFKFSVLHAQIEGEIDPTIRKEKEDLLSKAYDAQIEEQSFLSPLTGEDNSLVNADDIAGRKNINKSITRKLNKDTGAGFMGKTDEYFDRFKKKTKDKAMRDAYFVLSDESLETKTDIVTALGKTEGYQYLNTEDKSKLMGTQTGDNMRQMAVAETMQGLNVADKKGTKQELSKENKAISEDLAHLYLSSEASGSSLAEFRKSLGSKDMKGVTEVIKGMTTSDGKSLSISGIDRLMDVAKSVTGLDDDEKKSVLSNALYEKSKAGEDFRKRVGRLNNIDEEGVVSISEALEGKTTDRERSKAFGELVKSDPTKFGHMNLEDFEKSMVQSSIFNKDSKANAQDLYKASGGDVAALISHQTEQAGLNTDKIVSALVDH